MKKDGLRTDFDPESVPVPPPGARPDGVSDERGRIMLKIEPRVLVWSEPAEGGRIVVKMYRRRSRFSAVRRRFSRCRAQREYDALVHTFSHGIPCVEPLYWTAGHSVLHTFYEVLATREIPQATTLEHLMAEIPAQQPLPDLAGLFALIRRMHRSGMYHGQMYPYNVLLSGAASGQLRFYVIDLPRALVFSRDIAGTRMARHDLLDAFALGLYPRAGCERAVAWLRGGYGMSEADAERLAALAAVYRTTRALRNRVRGEFGLRAAVDRLLRMGPHGVSP